MPDSNSQEPTAGVGGHAHVGVSVQTCTCVNVPVGREVGAYKGVNERANA